MSKIILFLSFALGAGALNAAWASDPNKAHPHTGIAPKFTHPKPTGLTPAEKAELAQDKAVRKQIKYETGGRGVAIMDIQAPVDRVWAVIQDYGSYPNWIDMLQETEVYSRTSDHISVRFKLSVFGKGVEYFIEHQLQPAKGFMTWHLDYTRESDIDDSTGYWLVYPVPDNPSRTRVEYTVDLRLSGWIPDVVENMLAKKGLVTATSWVKQQAEAG